MSFPLIITNEITNEFGNLAINYHFVNPTGTIICFAGETVPSGWLLCNGSEITKSDYPKLFSVIGNVYGTSVNSNNLASSIAFSL